MINVIPLPKDYKSNNGSFIINDDTKITTEIELPLVSSKIADNGEIKIALDKSLGDEEYSLDITEAGVDIKASTAVGAYYGLQTLRQLSGTELGKGEAPCCSIKDSPRFDWRGVMLDESRHFFGMDEVKRLLDMMFMMKLNVFHWHLSDDQGWRIEIKKYPLLTEIGSVRAYTHINGWHSTSVINEKYGGYYTQEQIREIVDYAAQRGIMIVPEIDFPAHCAAAIAAYPWLACRELKRDVPGYFGGSIPQKKLHMFDWNRPICMGKDNTIEFVKDVIDEVCDLFPAPYFHIGGDEIDKREWKSCSSCQKRIADNNLKDVDDLHGWFNNLLLEYIKSKGKSLIGWNDILKAGNLDNSVVVQYWTPKRDKRAEEYSKNGGRMILSNHQSFYFDMTYSQYPLKNTYTYSPEKFKIDTKKGNILGVEGENWTEWIDGREKLELNLYPRMQALSEVAWSKDNADFDSFLKRVDSFKPFFNLLEIGYAVDKVSSPTKFIDKIKAQKRFMRGDTHYELHLNNYYKSQGEN